MYGNQEVFCGQEGQLTGNIYVTDFRLTISLSWWAWGLQIIQSSRT